jgi:hypothetical protein
MSFILRCKDLWTSKPEDSIPSSHWNMAVRTTLIRSTEMQFLPGWPRGEFVFLAGNSHSRKPTSITLPLARKRYEDWPVFFFFSASVYASMRSGLTTVQVSRPLLVPCNLPVSVNLHHYVYAFLRVSPKICRIIYTNIKTNIWQKYSILSRPPVNIWDCKNNSSFF